jgi:hypothetical protein
VADKSTARSPQECGGVGEMLKHVSAVIMLCSFVGGGVWWSAHQATAADEVDRRVTALERAKDENDKHWTEVAAHLGSIDATLQFMKEQFNRR